MSTDKYEPTKAEFLAHLIEGHANFEQKGASIQRSHRFPLWIFTQIENIAALANTSVSVVINQLLECGLEAVSKELTPDVNSQIRQVKPEQFNRPTKGLHEKVGSFEKPKERTVKKGEA
jgi:hypothetical protein